MRINENERKLISRLYIVAAAVFALLYTLCSFVIEPNFEATIYDIAYAETVIPDILNYLGDICEMLALAVFYATLSYGMYRLGNKQVRGMIALYVGANLYKYTGNIIMTWVDGGSIPRDWYIDVLNIAFFTAAEMISFAIIWFIIKRFTTAYRERQAVLAKVGKSERVFPFVGVYNKKNCLMNSALWCSVVMLALKIFGKIINDIATVEEIVSVPLMLLAYGANVVLAVLCYFAMILTLITLDEKLGKM